MGLNILNRSHVFSLFSLGLILLVSACSAPVKKLPPIAEKKLPEPAEPNLDRVFTELTGYGLGDLRAQHKEENYGKCVAAGRFGKNNKGKIVQLFCFSHLRPAPEHPRTRYWISFTSPEKQHRVWRVEISVPKKKMADLSLVSELKRNIGAPRRYDLPPALAWKNKTAHLTVKQDDYGTHFLLWDRSLH